MKILLLSRYSPLGASSRYRSYQFLPYLENLGCDITVSPLFDDAYLQEFYSTRKKTNLLPNILSAYLTRISKLLQTKLDSKDYDLIWLEKEALPWLPDWLECYLLGSKIPYVVDYDDALFHRYDQHKSPVIKSLLGHKIDAVMSNAALVIAGNDYLAARACEAGSNNVEILPTVVDLERYSPVVAPQNDRFTIGWIGTPHTAKYLKSIQPALKQVCQSGQAKVVAIGAGDLALDAVPLENMPWSNATEVQSLQSIDVGIMPLTDSPFERGKCGLKLIQYMACVRPVVGSPIGVNQQLIEPNVTGFQATTIDDWVTTLTLLSERPSLRKSMGEAARQLVEQNFSLQIAAPRLAQMFQRVVAQTVRK